jgi:carbonic anhydrase
MPQDICKINQNSTSDTSVYLSPIALFTEAKSNIVSDSRTFKYDANKEIFAEYDPVNVQWVVKNDYFLNINETNYKLITYHYHESAEHVIDDEKHAFEIHFVFFHSEVDYVVFGFIAKLADCTSSLLKNIVNGEPFKLPCMYKHNKFSYSGGLTKATDNHDEGDNVPTPELAVNWMLSTCTLNVSKHKLAKLQETSRGSSDLKARNGRNICLLKGTKINDNACTCNNH